MNNKELIKLQNETLKNIKDAKKWLENEAIEKASKYNYKWFVSLAIKDKNRKTPHVILLDGERVAIGRTGKDTWEGKGPAAAAVTWVFNNIIPPKRGTYMENEFYTMPNGEKKHKTHNFTFADIKAAKDEWVEEHIEIIPLTEWIERIKNEKK